MKTDTIQAALKAVEQAHGVRILLAVESGSRAWGFPSPDSDWDVRFIYAHSVDWYLQVRDRRDVIEQADGLLDLSGWDVRKAIGLLLKSNASAVEWLRSPVIYQERPKAVLLREFADRASLGGVQRHYYYLARSIWRERFASGVDVNIKKYFYLLRPSLALRYIRLLGMHPPMDLPALLAAASLPPTLARQIDDLVARKAISKEFDETARLFDIDALCETEMTLAEGGFVESKKPSERDYDDGDAVFRAAIGWPAQGTEARRAET